MTDAQMRDIAKIEVREYFDQFLNDVYPRLMNEHVNACRHGKTLNNVKWIGIGILLALAPSTGLSVFSIVQKLMVGS